MDPEYTYTCPYCSKECTVPQSEAGKNLICPSCSQEFFATPPEPLPDGFQPSLSLPEKLPFFKFGRKKILEEKIDELTADGDLNKKSEDELSSIAAKLGLDEAELTKMIRERVLKEFEPIKRRVELSLSLSDDDLAEIDNLQKRYDVKLTLEGFDQIYRSIYLIESKGQLPPPVSTELMLKKGEQAYYSIQATWHQTRSQSRGYAGTSVSIPSGIRGVRFRFGGYTPIRSEEMTPLSHGILYVTSQRLLFNGDSRSTAMNLDKILEPVLNFCGISMRA